MAVGPFCGVTPFLFRKKSIGNQGKGRSDGNRNPFRSKKFRNMKAAMVRGSREGSGNSVTMAELKNKITIFRDLLDLPLSVGSVSVNELLIVTVKDIRKMYPNLKLGAPVLEGKDASMYKCLKFLCDTLKSLGDIWTLDKGLGRCKYDPSKKLGKRQLERIALKLLDEMIKLAKERFIELTDEEEEMRCYDHHASSPTKGESGSYSDGAKSSNPGSPVTPKSVLPGPQKSRGKCFSPSMPKSKSVQSIRKLSSVDFKRISFYMLPDAISVAQVHKHSAKMNIDSELERKKAEVVEQDYVKKVSRDDSMVDYMDLSNEVNGESEAKSDALKISRSEDDVNMVSEEDGTVDNKEMSIEVNAEPEGKSDAFKIGGSDSVGKVSEEDVMVYYMEVSTEVTGEAEAKSDEGRNRIRSHHVNPVTAPMASAKQDELSSNVTEETASKPTGEVSVLPLVTPQPQATVSMPNLTEQDQPMQLPLRTSPPPPPSPETSGNAVCAPLPPAAPPPLETSGNAVCAPSPQERASAQLPGTSGNEVCNPPTPPPLAVGRPAPPMTPTNGLAPPPPPPLMGGSNGPTPPPPMPNGSAPPPPPRANGGGGPPPPPGGGGGGASLRLKKAATKLKRSSQMGTLYRRLKGKVEGTSSDGKPSGGKMGKAGSAPAGGKQGMADALAEMTKKSAYFLQIQEDVKNYLGVVKELKTTISAFQTSDMAELVKFHRHVESHLEKLTDESQVLARCEDFPLKKLEALRMSASLYTKLDTIATTLRDWSVAGMTLKQNLDKAEGYFDKIKVDLDSLERIKDDELKRFQAQKIMFDFGILIRIKELMVDLSSNCMELTLKEKKEVDSKQNGQPNEGLKKLMWRSFQFAYRVYTFAGGQDERADQLTKELADVIENGF